MKEYALKKESRAALEEKEHELWEKIQLLSSIQYHLEEARSHQLQASKMARNLTIPVGEGDGIENTIELVIRRREKAEEVHMEIQEALYAMEE